MVSFWQETFDCREILFWNGELRFIDAARGVKVQPGSNRI